jgi:hypothetical protein
LKSTLDRGRWPALHSGYFTLRPSTFITRKTLHGLQFQSGHSTENISLPLTGIRPARSLDTVLPEPLDLSLNTEMEIRNDVEIIRNEYKFCQIEHCTDEDRNNADRWVRPLNRPRLQWREDFIIPWNVTTVRQRVIRVI